MLKFFYSLFRKTSLKTTDEDIVIKLRHASTQTAEEMLKVMGSSHNGLSTEEAEKRLAVYGPNTVDSKPTPWYVQMIHCLFSQFNLILFFLAFVSWLTDDISGSILMTTMAVLSAIIRFYQEFRSGLAAIKLKSLVQNTIRVIRMDDDGEMRERDISMRSVVPGDIVKLAAGDMVPADMRIINSRDLYINQSMLTGEALPVEKNINEANPDTSLLEQPNLCFMGSNVVSGIAQGLILATGKGSYLGALAKEISQPPAPSSFDKGVYGVSMALVKVIVIIASLVFIINSLNTESWLLAMMFAIAVAVSLTPEMLPMIVAANLAKGAMIMAKSKVVVKHLSAINNFGSMDILCTDKTGTLTMDKIVLQHHLNFHYKEDLGVLQYAYLNSYHQTGLRNLLDNAILDHVQQDDHMKEVHADKFTKIDELPFDFARRRMSVVVKEGEQRTLICKGAVEEMSVLCTHIEYDGKIIELTPAMLKKVFKKAESLNQYGFKVLLIAYRHLNKHSHYSTKDEKDMVLKGMLAFLDPPKESAYTAIPALISLGIRVKVITGDNAEVTRYVCKQVGLEAESILLGPDIEKMSDQELSDVVADVEIFAKIAPMQKARIIKALRDKEYTVGFMGDGVNDALALHEADVGISVDTGVDIAKESADIILLEKSLLVLERGIVEGRITFMNVMKYIKMTLSANFGNVLSILGASAIFPFLPMMPAQLLLQNFLYDLSQTTIPFDNVDPDSITKPKQWSQRDIIRFMVFMGPISSVFDYIAFAALWFYFGGNGIENQHIFQTGWFMSGLLTQTLIVHMIRTAKMPFIQSIAAPIMLFSTALIVLIGLYLPYSSLAAYAQFSPPDASYFIFLVFIALGYWTLTSVVKRLYIKAFNTW